jgi:hypothetical protein
MASPFTHGPAGPENQFTTSTQCPAPATTPRPKGAKSPGSLTAIVGIGHQLCECGRRAYGLGRGGVCRAGLRGGGPKPGAGLGPPRDRSSARRRRPACTRYPHNGHDPRLLRHRSPKWTAKAVSDRHCRSNRPDGGPQPRSFRHMQMRSGWSLPVPPSASAAESLEPPRARTSARPSSAGRPAAPAQARHPAAHTPIATAAAPRPPPRHRSPGRKHPVTQELHSTP